MVQRPANQVSAWCESALFTFGQGGAAHRAAVCDLWDAEQVARPEFFKSGDPAFVNLPDRYDVQRIHPLPAFLARLYEVSFAKHVDVFHNSEPRQVRKSVDDFGRSSWTLPQQIENCSPGRIREGFPDRIEVVSLHWRRAIVPVVLPAVQSAAMESSRNCQPELTPSRCVGSISPMAR